MSGENHSALLPIKSDLRVTNSLTINFQEHYIEVREETDTSIFHIMNMENKMEKQTKLWLKPTTGISFLSLKGM